MAALITQQFPKPEDWPVIQLQQNLPDLFTVQLLDEAGNPLDVGTQSDASSSGPSASASSACTETIVGSVITFTCNEVSTIYGAELRLKTHYQDPQYTSILGTVLNAAIGQFAFQVTADNVSYPGLFLGDILFTDQAGVLLFVRRCFVEIESNLTDTYNSAPPTISEIRLALRDQSPEANYLLDDMEFSNREILFALRTIVDLWNETPPDIIRYSYAAFPFRSWWIRGAIAKLYLIAASGLRRNQLPYKGDGLQVDDKARHTLYEQIGRAGMEEFTHWMEAKKGQIDFDSAFGSTG